MNGARIKLESAEQLIKAYDENPANFNASKYDLSGIKLPTENKPLMSKIIQTMIKLSEINLAELDALGAGFLTQLMNKRKITGNAQFKFEQYNQLCLHALTCGDAIILNDLKQNFKKLREALLEREEPQAKAFGKSILKLEVHVSLLDELLIKHPTLLPSLKEDAITSKNLVESYRKLREFAFNPTHILDPFLMRASKGTRDLIKADAKNVVTHKDKIIDRALSFALGILMFSQLDLTIRIIALVMGFVMCTPNPAATMRALLRIVKTLFQLSVMSHIAKDMHKAFIGAESIANPIPLVVLVLLDMFGYINHLAVKDRTLEFENNTLGEFQTSNQVTLKAQPTIYKHMALYRKNLRDQYVLDMISATIPEGFHYFDVSPETTRWLTQWLFKVFTVSSLFHAIKNKSLAPLITLGFIYYGYEKLPTGHEPLAPFDCDAKALALIENTPVILLDKIGQCTHGYSVTDLSIEQLINSLKTIVAQPRRIDTKSPTHYTEAHLTITLTQGAPCIPSRPEVIITTHYQELKADAYTKNPEVIREEIQKEKFSVTTLETERGFTVVRENAQHAAIMFRMILASALSQNPIDHPRVELVG